MACCGAASRDSVCLQYNTHSIGTNYPHSIAASMVCRFSSHRSVHASNIPRLCLTGRPAPFTDIGRATARRQTLSQRPRFPLHTVSAISPPVDPVQRLIEEDFREITKANGVIEGKSAHTYSSGKLALSSCPSWLSRQSSQQCRSEVTLCQGSGSGGTILSGISAAGRQGPQCFCSMALEATGEKLCGL